MLSLRDFILMEGEVRGENEGETEALLVDPEVEISDSDPISVDLLNQVSNSSQSIIQSISSLFCVHSPLHRHTYRKKSIQCFKATNSLTYFN